MIEVTLQNVEEYWDRRPCNIKHSNAPVGTREYFDEVERKKYRVESHIPKFADFATWKDKKVLEIGCGIGTDAMNFIRAGSIYTGIELSNESLEIARKRLMVYDLDGELLKCNIENPKQLMDSKGVFDLVYSFGVLHHTPDIILALKNIRQLISSSGILKIMVYAKNSWKQKMINAGLDQPEAQYGCPIANSYTSEEIEGLLSHTGFKVTSIRQDHIFPYQIEPYKRHQYVKHEYFATMPSEVFQVLEKNFGWHLLVDAIPA